MDRPASTRNLRVCPACWSVVHVDDLASHDQWHQALARTAVADAKRELRAERHARLRRLLSGAGARPAGAGIPAH